MAEQDDATQPQEPSGGLLDDLVPPEEAAAPKPPTEPEPEPAPVEPAPEPEPKPEPAASAPEPEPVQPRTFAPAPAPAPDAWDAEYTEALKEIDADDLKSPSERRIAKLQLTDLREQRLERRASHQQSAEDQYRDSQAREFGVTREVIDKSWVEAWTETAKELGYESVDAARLLYRQKVKAAKTAPKPMVPAPASGPKPSAAAPQRTITLGGGRVIPGTHRHTPPPPVKKDAAEVVLETVGQLKDWKV